MSKLTGIKQNTLACYITGKRNPSDITTKAIEQAITAHLQGDSAYINKTLYRDLFMEQVYDILTNVPESQQPIEIMKAFDALPTVNIPSEKK